LGTAISTVPIASVAVQSTARFALVTVSVAPGIQTDGAVFQSREIVNVVRVDASLKTDFVATNKSTGSVALAHAGRFAAITAIPTAASVVVRVIGVTESVTQFIWIRRAHIWIAASVTNIAGVVCIAAADLGRCVDASVHAAIATIPVAGFRVVVCAVY